MNPFEDIVQNNIAKKMDNSNYRPMPFYPSAYPTDYPTYLTNILLKTDGNDKYLTTENGDEMFMDDTIVEFKFDATKPKQWQWIPIRVRNDKTTEYKNGKKNYGNSYKVADSVWRSINNPVTEDIICGKEKPGTIDENLYYNRTTNKSNTVALRDFHNKYVKKKLIDAVSSPGDTLIDMTVGKAGDLYKWIQSKLSFVFGMDLYKDNILNRLDGACARWLGQKSKIKNIPDALFIAGDAGKDLLSGQCCTSEKNKEIINAVFGKGPRDEDFLGTGVYNQYGKADKGFDIVSNQFSIHYLFEKKEVFLSFIKNISDACKLGGHFIGTCFDGKRMFRDLRNKKMDESIIVRQGDKKIWEVVKKYDNEVFNNDDTSLGYKIEVYQETINKYFAEYLVNFDYLTHVMELFGFTKLTINESKKIGFAASIHSFKKVHDSMEYEVNKNPTLKYNIGQALNMTPEEKRISFYNNYFIYKKIRNVDSESVKNALLHNMEIDESLTKEYNKVIGKIEKEKELEESAKTEESKKKESKVKGKKESKKKEKKESKEKKKKKSKKSKKIKKIKKKIQLIGEEDKEEKKEEKNKEGQDKKEGDEKQT